MHLNNDTDNPGSPIPFPHYADALYTAVAPVSRNMSGGTAALSVPFRNLAKAHGASLSYTLCYSLPAEKILKIRLCPRKDTRDTNLASEPLHFREHGEKFLLLDSEEQMRVKGINRKGKYRAMLLADGITPLTPSPDDPRDASAEEHTGLFYRTAPRSCLWYCFVHGGRRCATATLPLSLPDDPEAKLFVIRDTPLSGLILPGKVFAFANEGSDPLYTVWSHGPALEFCILNGSDTEALLQDVRRFACGGLN